MHNNNPKTIKLKRKDLMTKNYPIDEFCELHIQHTGHQIQEAAR